MRATSSPQWLVADQLGTPRMVINQTGALSSVKCHDYYPFGEELSAGAGGRTTQQGYSQSDGVRQKFTAYEHDAEANLEFAQARYYSSPQGRFTSVDPLAASMSLTDPQTLNRYSYVANNPLSFTDPSGMIMGSRKDGNPGGISVFEGGQYSDTLSNGAGVGGRFYSTGFADSYYAQQSRQDYFSDPTQVQVETAYIDPFGIKGDLDSTCKCNFEISG